MAVDHPTDFQWFTRKGWCILIIGVVIVGAIVSTGVKAIQQSAHCTLAVTAATLPPALAADGILGQPLSSVSPGALQTEAKEAILVEFPDLANPVAQDVIPEHPQTKDLPTVDVVPFRSAGVSNAIVGVVAFAMTCANEAVYDGMENWQVGPYQRLPRINEFPSIGRDLAQSQLHVSQVTLEYSNSPFSPFWSSIHHAVLDAVPPPS